MSEQSTYGGGLLGYAAVLWAALPDDAAARVAGGASGGSGGSGVPERRGDAGAANPAPRDAGGRRIGA